jgi:hypothetical protein
MPMSAYVLFFGGYQSTQANIKALTADAIQKKPGVTFDGYPTRTARPGMATKP